jgi:hypothetical protein
MLGAAQVNAVRRRVMKWLEEAASKWPQFEFKLGSVTDGRTADKNDAYFRAIRDAKIVVTADPAYYEGGKRAVFISTPHFEQVVVLIQCIQRVCVCVESMVVLGAQSMVVLGIGSSLRLGLCYRPSTLGGVCGRRFGDDEHDVDTDASHGCR